MGGNDIRKMPSELPEPEDWPPDIKECSLPPCMMRELNLAFLEHSERNSAPARPPAVDAKQDWEEVRLWRKAKRAVLIERRLAVPTGGARRAQRGDYRGSGSGAATLPRHSNRLLLAVQGRL